MGDMVMMTTLVTALSSRYGCPVDILSSGPWTRPLLAGQPGVGSVYLLEGRSLPFLFSAEKRSLVIALRQRGPGPTWYCDTDDRCLRLLQTAGIGADLVCRASQLPLQDGEHLVDYWQRFACQAPAAPGQPPAEKVLRRDPQLLVSQRELDEAQSWLGQRKLDGRQLLLIQPGNKRTMRRGFRRRPSNTKWWPEARWAAVVQALSELHPQAAILMLGVPQEYDLNQQIMALAGRRNVYNLACDLPMARLLALQTRASAMVSVDTGPAHSAAAVGCPVLVLFGVADPVRISPRAGATPVRHLAGRGKDGPTMLGIAVEQVLAAWQELPKR